MTDGEACAVVDLVAKIYRVKPEIILGRDRRRYASVPRAALVWKWGELGMSGVEIARRLGRDRATVVYLRRVHAWRRLARLERACGASVTPFKVWAEREAKERRETERSRKKESRR